MWKLYSQRVKDVTREVGKHFQMNKVKKKKNPTNQPNCKSLIKDFKLANGTFTLRNQ